MESHFTVTSSCDCAIKGKFLHGEKKKWLRDSLAYSDAHSYEPVSEISPCFIENICFTVGTRWRGLSFTISGEIRAYFQPYINQKCANMCFCWCFCYILLPLFWSNLFYNFLFYCICLFCQRTRHVKQIISACLITKNSNAARYWIIIWYPRCNKCICKMYFLLFHNHP